MDFDWLHKRLYYTDNALKTISSSYIDGTNITTLLSGLDKPRAIAVDPCRGKKKTTENANNTLRRRFALEGWTVLMRNQILHLVPKVTCCCNNGSRAVSVKKPLFSISKNSTSAKISLLRNPKHLNHLWASDHSFLCAVVGWRLEC